MKEIASLEAIIEAIGDGISIQGADMKVLYQNQVHKELNGEHIGEYCFRAYAQSDTICEGCPVILTFTDGNVHTVEKTCVSDKGTCHMEITASALKDSSGTIVAGIEVVRNVTGYRQSEERRKLLEKAVETLPFGICITDMNGKIVYVNSAAQEMHGYAAHEMLGKDFSMVSRDKAMPFDQARDGGVWRIENVNIRKDGMPFPVEIISRAVSGPDGHPLGIVIACEDITELKKNEAALRDSEERYRSFLQNFHGIAFRGGMDFIPSFFHGAVKSITGYTEKEFLAGKPRWDQVIHPDDLTGVEENARELRSVPGHSAEREYRIVRKDGQIRWIHERIQNICDGLGNPFMVQGTLYDVTERKQAEELLKESEERFRQIFEQNGDALFLFKRENGEILDANPAAVSLYGYMKEEFIGNNSSLFLKAPDELGKFQQALCDLDTIDSIRIDRLTTMRKDGTNVIVSIWGNIVRLKESDVLTCSFRDITEKIRLEEEAKLIRAKLIQTNKMTSLGTLVSGVAHEINNPNNFIMFNAQLLADIWKDVVAILTEYYGKNVDFPIGNIPFAEMRGIIPKLLSGISEGSRRINDIVDNLKNYIRQDRSSLDGQVDIRKMITAATSILGNQIRKHTENYNLIFDGDLPLIRGSAQQLEQVIINLIMNAFQALPDKNRGIWISASLDTENRSVLIRIKDEGIGMPAEVLGRIPEPFFTTKRDQGGTGLGLSISYSIIKDHGGSLKFESEPGNGTVVSITLPTE